MAKVSVSTKLAAPADKVWSLIGGWNTVPDWHPAVEKSETEQGGQFRRLQFTDGAEITERLEKFDRDGRTYTYSITASPLPFTDYRSTITVRAEGDGSTIDWSSEFEPSGAPEADVIRSLKEFYQAGFENIRKLLGGH
jgi:Polyketide cyclase / dehydrase and lipid transport